MATYRLQKILARGGLASRRKAEELVTAGRVRVNGRIVTELGAKADPTKDKIEVDGKRVVAEAFVYVVLHKPRGVVATMSDPEGRPTVRDYLAKVPGRVYSVGRLDFATSGVLLATNDGDFSDALLHPRKSVPKTYVVKVAGEMQEKDLERWHKGVRLDDGMTRPAEVSFLRHEDGKTWFQLTIREGRNQQIRRMGEATGFPVMRLARVSFAGITSEDLRPGDFRHLTRDELMALRKEYGVPKKMPTLPPAARTRPERPARPERAGRPERGERTARHEGPARAGRGESPARPERGERHTRPERSARPERGARSGRPERADGAGHPERGDRPRRPERPRASHRGERPERHDRHERPERHDGSRVREAIARTFERSDRGPREAGPDPRRPREAGPDARRPRQAGPDRPGRPREAGSDRGHRPAGSDQRRPRAGGSEPRQPREASPERRRPREAAPDQGPRPRGARDDQPRKRNL